MRKRMMIATVLALCVSAGAAVGRAAQPSAGCGSGPGDAAGVGTKYAASGDAMVCVHNSSAPAKGAVSLHGDSTAKSGYVDFDGDSTNNAKPCADGFARVAGDQNGLRFYESPDGNYNDTNPSMKGNQQAQSEAPDKWAGNLKTNCAG